MTTRKWVQLLPEGLRHRTPSRTLADGLVGGRDNFLLLRATPAYSFAFALALTAFVFAFAYASPWLGCLRFGDYSYGVYLWGFPMQQVIAHLAPRLTPAGNILLAWPLAMLLAVLSWHLVERPALRLKSMPSVVLAKARLVFGCIRAGG